MSSRAQVVATGLMWPEGPAWCSDGTVVCTAVAEGALYRVWLAAGRTERIAVVRGGANAAALVDDGGFLVTQNGGTDFATTGLFAVPPPFDPVTPGLQRVLPDGSVTYLADDGFRAPNDLVVAADGTVFFTDPPSYPPPVEPVGRVHAYTNGVVRTIAAGFGYCNGIGFEPDGTLVVVEAQGLMRLGLDGEKDWISQTVGAGPDGFCCDVDGNFYVATTSDHGIRVLDAKGTEIDFLPIGAGPGGGIVTNCCFGGDDGRSLFATDGSGGQLVVWEGMPVPGREVYPWPVPGSPPELPALTG